MEISADGQSLLTYCLTVIRRRRRPRCDRIPFPIEFDPRNELRGWKAIADYLDVSVRTVQNWEKDLGLPVRRHPGAHGRIYATSPELDVWKHGRKALSSAEDSTIAGQDQSGSDALPASNRRVERRLHFAAAILTGALLTWLFEASSVPSAPDRFVSSPLTAEEAPERFPDLSPDGRTVAFLSACSDGSGACIWTRELSGGSRRSLAKNANSECFPRWSPDGTRIAFLRPLDRGMDLVVVNVENGVETRFAHLQDDARKSNIVDVTAIAWSPDGESIVFSRRPTIDQRYQLTLLRPNGQSEPLTDPPSSTPGDSYPAFSHGGKRLAFTRFVTHSESDIYVMDWPPGEARRVTRAHARIWGLDWDGSGGIVDASHPNRGRSRIYHLPALQLADEEPIPLSGPEVTAEYPRVALLRESGEALLVYEQRYREHNIWSVDLNDSRTPVKAASSSWSESFPACGVNDQLAFISTRTGTHEVWYQKNSLEPARRLTHIQGPYTDMPRWSPDGRRILFSSATGDNRDIFIVDLLEGETGQFTTAKSEEGRGSWSRDGRWIYFRSDRTGAHEIWKRRSDGTGKALRVTRRGGYEAFEAPDGRHLLYSKERDAAELWEVPVGGGEERKLLDGPRESLWAISERWVYFLDGNEIRRFALETGETESVYDIDSNINLRGGFGACADRPRFFWGQIDIDRADLWIGHLPKR